MTEQLITFETAKLAKEKGFDIPCWNFFSKEDKEEDIMNWVGVNFKQKLSVARKFVRYWKPTQSYLQKWLREVHNIHIQLAMHEFGKWVFGLQLQDKGMEDYPRISKNNVWDIEDYNSYEDALEAGIYQALKLI